MSEAQRNMAGFQLRPLKPEEAIQTPGNPASRSTEISRTVRSRDGKWMNVPSLWMGPDGVHNYGDMSDDNLAKLSERFEQMTGNRFIRFDDEPTASAAAAKRSDEGGAGSPNSRYEKSDMSISESQREMMSKLLGSSSRRMLKRGAKGVTVRALQLYLRDHGFAIKADGNFGPETEKALKAYQKGAGIPADGVAGAKTFARIKAAISTPRPNMRPETQPAPMAAMEPPAAPEMPMAPEPPMEPLAAPAEASMPESPMEPMPEPMPEAMPEMAAMGGGLGPEALMGQPPPTAGGAPWQPIEPGTPEYSEAYSQARDEWDQGGGSFTGFPAPGAWQPPPPISMGNSPMAGMDMAQGGPDFSNEMFTPTAPGSPEMDEATAKEALLQALWQGFLGARVQPTSAPPVRSDLYAEPEPAPPRFQSPMGMYR